jgi:LAGLIDADG DNA endonuclease family protein
MDGDNPSGGDYQQGRPRCSLTPDYVAGFVDGEGCFSVSIRPHPTVRYGGRRWLIGPVFQVYQHQGKAEILEAIRQFFDCGRIVPKGPHSSVLTYSVYRRSDLELAIVPFFERNPLLSGKQQDFLKFSEVVRLMQKKEHQTEEGFRRIVELAFSMNQRGKQRRYRLEEVLAEPSETVRRALPPTEGVMRQSDPYGDMGRAAEMTVPLLERFSSSGGNRRA